MFIGTDRPVYEKAVKLSQERNIVFLDRPVKKVVAYLDKEEFKTAWVGNKAIYRTRMAIADGGKLVILAPGIRQFGENCECDALIRKYGFIGRERVLNLLNTNDDLKKNQSISAHLIHASTEGRFNVTYALDKLEKEDMESVNFNYMPLSEAYDKYDPSLLCDGFNTMEDGEEIFFVKYPALGLWVDRNRFI